ncbi:MAG: molybdopterin-dependent oxidoreductase, partial [Dehalococcoidia bacterium]|nr:molybdopterin-dependent oxidoreductase [Dehalococcoidia bacterium]
ADGKIKSYDSTDIKDASLEGSCDVNGVKAKPAFQLLLEHTKEYTPEWASPICDVPAKTIRNIARDFVENARIGETIEIEGVKLPYRPASINLGKSVNNGFGSYLTVWTSHVISMLVGGIEVPGGHCTVYSRFQPGPVKPGEDGFPFVSIHPTDTKNWQWPPDSRDGLKTLCPISVSMGPSHLSYRNMADPPPNWPRPSVPDIWVTYIGNPLVSQWDRDTMIKVIRRIPFYVAFAYTINETNQYADILLPDNINLESLQLCPVGDKKSARGWYSSGYHLRQPVVKPPFNTRDISDIFTELAERIGILREYNDAINNGICGRIRLQEKERLEPGQKYSAEEIWQRLCQSANEGQMDWNELKETGFFVK